MWIWVPFSSSLTIFPHFFAYFFLVSYSHLMLSVISLLLLLLCLFGLSVRGIDDETNKSSNSSIAVIPWKLRNFQHSSFGSFKCVLEFINNYSIRLSSWHLIFTECWWFSIFYSFFWKKKKTLNLVKDFFFSFLWFSFAKFVSRFVSVWRILARGSRSMRTYNIVKFS